MLRTRVKAEEQLGDLVRDVWAAVLKGHLRAHNEEIVRHRAHCARVRGFSPAAISHAPRAEKEHNQRAVGSTGQTHSLQESQVDDGDTANKPGKVLEVIVQRLNGTRNIRLCQHGSAETLGFQLQHHGRGFSSGC